MKLQWVGIFKFLLLNKGFFRLFLLFCIIPNLVLTIIQFKKNLLKRYYHIPPLKFSIISLEKYFYKNNHLPPLLYFAVKTS